MVKAKSRGKLRTTLAKTVQTDTVSSQAFQLKKYTGWIVLGVVILFLLMFIGLVVGTYNGLVKGDEAVKAQWSNVESSYQRRFDLVPNLVATVQGAANFEKSTLTDIVEARSAWANSKTIGDKVQAASGLDSAISRLLVTVESYPQLTATQGFQDLQVQLEGTENRINVERNRYNDVVKDYNVKLRTFPNVLFAGMFGFSEEKSFEAQNGAENAPKVNFN